MPVFFKQRDNLFFPAWAFVLPSTLVRFPISLIESLLWTVFTYFEISLTLDAGRYALCLRSSETYSTDWRGLP